MCTCTLYKKDYFQKRHFVIKNEATPSLMKIQLTNTQ